MILRTGVSFLSLQPNRNSLLVVAFVGLAVSSCSDDPSRPAVVLDRRVPVYNAEWEMDVWSFAVDGEDSLHVTQYWEPDVLKYSTDGSLLGRWFVVVDQDTLLASSLTFANGYCIALALSRVVVLDKNHAVVTSWPERNMRNFTGGGDLIDADAYGNIYVLDDNRDLVVKYRFDGSFEREWAVEHLDSLGNGGLAGIAVDDAGSVCVSDYWRNQILVYTADGRLLRKFGKFGRRPSEFDGPRGLDISAGILYVADQLNFRVKKFTLHGLYLSDFYSRGTHGQGLDPPESVDVDGNMVFVMHENSILRFDYTD